MLRQCKLAVLLDDMTNTDSSPESMFLLQCDSFAVLWVSESESFKGQLIDTAVAFTASKAHYFCCMFGDSIF